ncbi:MAG TPA: hypothetical protein P5172_11155 [Syntrophales bacterium]|nr:hypothetical protein [Syntrophales bacterium]HRU89490.1 hypothetical protein [Syntrophales bacterium]
MAAAAKQVPETKWKKKKNSSHDGSENWRCCCDNFMEFEIFLVSSPEMTINRVAGICR